MANYLAKKRDNETESDVIIGNFVANMESRNIRKHNYNYDTSKYRSSTKSMKIYAGGEYEVPMGVYSTGSKTVECYVWASIVGAVKVSVFSPAGDLIETLSNTLTGQWERIAITFTASTIDNYSILFQNLISPNDNISDNRIYIDDVSLLN